MRRRLYLVAIAAVAAVPILLFAAALGYNQASRERSNLEERVWRTTRDAAMEIDQTLSRHVAALEAISAFVAPDGSDLEELQRGAAARLRNQYGWKRLRLVDARTMQIVASVGEPEGGTHARAAEQIAQVVRSGRPVATVLPRELADAVPRVVIRAPVLHEGRIDMVLTAEIDSRVLGDVLRRVAPGAAWTVAAIDPAFRIGGRNRAEEEFIGTTITPSLRERVERSVESFFFSLNKEGERVYTLFIRSQGTGWTVAIGAPAAVVEQPLFWSNLTMLGAGGGTVLIAGLLAFFLVGNFERRQRAEEELHALAAEAATEWRISEIARNFPGVIYRRVLRPDGRVSYPFVSSGVESLLGLSVDELRGPLTMTELSRVLHGNHLARWRDALDRSAQELAPFKVEVAVHTQGGERWLRSMAVPHREQDGSIAWDGVVLDITEERRADEQRRLLMAELDHRVRNILAVVSAIASASLPDAGTAETFRGRLRALAHAHGLLAETGWEGASLEKLLEAELAPYRLGGDDRRITLEGEPVSLKPAAAQSLALAIHELATNAAKHGALSVARGEVRLAWGLEQGTADTELCIRWVESGGPPARAPGRRGFGHRLVEESIGHGLGGRSRLEFPEGGLRCIITIPAGHAVAAI
ncbi:HWE histidine kinase domain-containing protein [Geminicoccaceae bacterium 1502E]|nr:HWE histidine kinase domain-containing protein [Geminicoccaceae bacterium 1502E]